MYSITFWGGRFGNNIQQISNAIFYCKENSLNFKSPPNDLINSFQVNFGYKFCDPRIFFFHIDSELKNGNSDFQVDVAKLRIERRNICRKYIYPNLKINFNNISDLGDNTIVAHIRSGDIFSRKNYYCSVVSSYLQNPLCYYLEIFKDYKNVIVITEDYENPVVMELSKIDNVQIITENIENTIELILSAQNIVTSGVSSFAIACALLSGNVKKLYYSNLFLNEVLNYNEFFDDKVQKIEKIIDLEKYIGFDKWINTDEQRKLMIDYKCN